MDSVSYVDVFSGAPFKGNALAVFHDADGLSDEQITDIARWTNLSETTFLVAPTDPAADYAWTGSFGASEDGAPSIGRVPGLPRAFACLGYGGNGTTFSMLAAQMIAADLGGAADPDAALFAFRR